MSKTTTPLSDDDAPNPADYPDSKAGFTLYLHDLADAAFPFPAYREGQDEALYEALEELYVNGKDNVILDLPTGVGKSPLNVTIAAVTSFLASSQQMLADSFSTRVNLTKGQSFYTTPQKQLREQLVEDGDLEPYVDGLKARADYVCGETGSACDSCAIQSDPEKSCLDTPACTYWDAKMMARSSDVATLTFAMLILDNNVPPETQEGQPLGFRDRDVLIVDEGQDLENQAASLFAGYSVSPWSLPPTVFDGAGRQANWSYERFHEVEDILSAVARRAKDFADLHEENPNKQKQVRNCENYLRKFQYTLKEIGDGREWVVNVSETTDRDGDSTKKIEMKPVYVDKFLARKVFSRGRKRVISSATIPYRDNIQQWCERLGLGGRTALISKSMPFDREHRLISTATESGPMSGDSEEENWGEAMQKLREVRDQHPGEKGVVHTNSYNRAEKVRQWVDGVMMDDQEKDSDVVIQEWQDSDKQILATPAMTQGVDLHGDLCRWQALLKVPFGAVGDERVSYLLNEEKDWNWYYSATSIAIQQSVGRAVRGPEPEEAASYYVLDSKFHDVVSRTAMPNWFTEAITDSPPQHWSDEESAPWR
jgi:hypothetical protein